MVANNARLIAIARCVVKKYKNGIKTRRVIKTRSVVHVRTRTRRGTRQSFTNLQVSRNLEACKSYWLKQLGVTEEELQCLIQN